MKRWNTFILGALGLALLAGCHTPKGPGFDPGQPSAQTAVMEPVDVSSPIEAGWLRPQTNFYTLGPGDRLEVELLGYPATHTTTTVGPDGKIYFDLLPGVDVWGLTLDQAKERLEHEMAKFVRDDPRVALNLRETESRRIWLMGRVTAPGSYALSQPMTLLEAISAAGGPASAAPASGSVGGAAMPGPGIADLGRSFVMRGGKLLPVNFERLLDQGDLTQNIYLEPNDFVYLPSAAAKTVYVLGAVSQPKMISFSGRPRPTLIAAIADSGGTIFDAYLTHVAIIRGSLTQPRIAIVDYRAVAHGGAPDVLLEPDDIVYVPFTPYHVVTRYANLVLETFVRTVGANEGVRAVTGENTPVSPNVPIGAP